MASSSYCGIDCPACAYRESTNCRTCKPNRGEMFWGKCRVASCCIEKGVEDCGLCDAFPCALLKEFAFDEGQGDGGQRIANLCRENKLESPACGQCCGGKCAKEQAG